MRRFYHFFTFWRIHLAADQKFITSEVPGIEINPLFLIISYSFARLALVN